MTATRRLGTARQVPAMITAAVVVSCAALAWAAGPDAPQQVADGSFRPVIARPEYPPGAGPVVLVDRAHNNFHAPDEHFVPFARLIGDDGYRVRGLHGPLTADALKGVAVLVIVNALADEDVDRWVLPTSPAFTAEEVGAVRDWVRGGGALLLIADHMPFPGAAADLARAFGLEFMNGFAIVEAEWDPLVFRRSSSTLRSHPITNGRSGEQVNAAVTFVAGQAFRATDDRVCPLLVFGPGVVSINMERAWVFDATTPRVNVEGWLQGAAVEIGAGRVAVFGEAAMFAAQLTGPRKTPTGMNAPIARENLQLLLNTMHWLSRAPGFDSRPGAARCR